MSGFEIRFHTSVLLEPGILSTHMIRRVCGTNFALSDAYFPAFVSVIVASVSPEHALAEIQADWPTEE